MKKMSVSCMPLRDIYIPKDRWTLQCTTLTLHSACWYLYLCLRGSGYLAKIMMRGPGAVRRFEGPSPAPAQDPFFQPCNATWKGRCKRTEAAEVMVLLTSVRVRKPLLDLG